MRSSPPELRPRIAGIVPAAGSGTRLGPGLPKALRTLGGAPLLLWAVRSLAAHPATSLVVVAAPAAEVEDVRELVADCDVPVVVVVGGATRQESVGLALGAVPGDVTHVLVHDAARPLVPEGVVARVVEGLGAGAVAVIPVVPVTDTIKRVEGATVLETPRRDELRAVQTPQGFDRAVLERAHASATPGATDDAELVERLGISVSTVAGDPEAFKITNDLDLQLAGVVLGSRAATVAGRPPSAGDSA